MATHCLLGGLARPAGVEPGEATRLLPAVDVVVRSDQVEQSKQEQTDRYWGTEFQDKKRVQCTMYLFVLLCQYSTLYLWLSRPGR